MLSTLNALTLKETKEMISTKCEYGEIKNPFSDEAVERIYNQTLGNPRDILKACSILYVMMQQFDLDEIPIDEIENIKDEIAL